MIRYRLTCSDASSANNVAKLKKPSGGKPSAGTKSARAARNKQTGCGHSFESWFQSSDAFDTLVKRGQVSCPACGSKHVEKALMAPSVKTSKGEDKPNRPPPPTQDNSLPAVSAAPQALATLTPQQRAYVDAMRKIREHVLSNSEDVGKRFVEEARKIHHEETDARSIHGEASIDEAKALAEEGIDIFPIPVLPDDRN